MLETLYVNAAVSHMCISEEFKKFREGHELQKFVNWQPKTIE
jgi:hypothetical protein